MTPERVRTFALDRLPETLYPKKFHGTAREVREQRRAPLRDLTVTVRRILALTQKLYKGGYDKRVHPVNEALRVGDWVYVVCGSCAGTDTPLLSWLMAYWTV